MSDALDRVRLDTTWKEALRSEFTASYMSKLRAFLVSELQAGKRIHPPMSKMFAALDLCPLDRVRVVIIGQDPYHGPNQAHGLCFSVSAGVTPPPSLVNILSEIDEEFGNGDREAGTFPVRGCLEPWAKQGVLLLNSVLTVVEGRAGSHQGIGWERFTDQIVSVVNDRCEHVVFLLWGAAAKRKAGVVDRTKHLVLESSHPSPLSAHRGFMGCGHFATANGYLTSKGFKAIDWLAVA